jgi:hypothetical protein
MHFQPHITASPQTRWSPRRQTGVIALVVGPSLLIAAPLVWNGIQLFMRGEYVTQQYYWRNAPVGIDVATLVMGNPTHGVWGSLVRNLYTRLGIDAIESIAWLGVVPLVLSIWAVHHKPNDRAVRTWTAVCLVFVVWALGSHVFAFGRNIALIMPGSLLRYVPIVSNARMPGRAMVMVYLAVAILGAIGAADYSSRRRRPTLALAVIALVVTAEFFAPPFPIVPIGCPAIYRTLHDRPERGAVAELPLGVRDGLGAITPIDSRVLVCQTVHERPLVGGFVARLSPKIIAAYRTDPLIAMWLHLSGDTLAAAPSDLLTPAERLKASGVDFVVLNRLTASAAMREHLNGLPLIPLAEDETYTLYVRK